jgi:hypothetical protein
MKKVFLIFLAASFLFSSQIPATASTTKFKFGEMVTIWFPSVVTLKKTGCQDIPVRYSVGKLPYPYTEGIGALYVYIVDDADKRITSLDGRFYEPLKEGEKVWKRNSVFKVKVCRKVWSDDNVIFDSGEVAKYLGVKKGTYRIVLGIMFKGEEYSTIKFK